LNKGEIIALNPELMNRIRYLEGEHAFVRLNELDFGKPSIESVVAYMRPDITRDLFPNPSEALFHSYIIHSSHAASDVLLAVSPTSPCPKRIRPPDNH
jgi:hypothetical protein